MKAWKITNEFSDQKFVEQRKIQIRRFPPIFAGNPTFSNSTVRQHWQHRIIVTWLSSIEYNSQWTSRREYFLECCNGTSRHFLIYISINTYLFVRLFVLADFEDFSHRMREDAAGTTPIWRLIRAVFHHTTNTTAKPIASSSRRSYTCGLVTV